MDDPDISDATQEAYNVVVTLVTAAICVAVALAVSVLVGVVMNRLGRKRPLARRISARMRRPMRLLLVVIALIVAVQISVPREDVVWRAPVNHLLVIVLIGFGAWLLAELALLLEDQMLDRFTIASGGADADDRHSRRARTQIQVIRRLTIAAVVIIAVGGALMTFPEARAAGASLFASAGLVSVIAGLAAQTTLSNVFAGMQIAFTDGIRSDDVVVVEGQWGRIEEITLTYVVVHVWDDRRLILPSTYFTTTTFENWTRRQSALLGTVELDLDWEVPIDAMRTVLKGLLVESELWDERVGILQVTDATGGSVKVRALVSAGDSGTLWDLRCFVREGLVAWLQRWAPQALPRIRVGDATAKAEAPQIAAPRSDAQAVAEHADGVLPVAARASEGAGAEEPGGEAHTAPDGTPQQGEPRFDLSGASSERSSWRRRRSLRRLQRDVSIHAAAPGVGVETDGVAPAGAPASRLPAPSDDATRVLSAEELRGLVPGGGSGGAAARAVDTPPEPTSGTFSVSHESALFSGSAEAEERSKAFAGPGEEVYAQREENAERGWSGTGAVERDEQDEDAGDGSPVGADGRPDDGPDDGPDGGGGTGTGELAGLDAAEARRRDPAGRRAPRGGDATGDSGGTSGDGGGDGGDGGGDGGS